MLAKPNFLQYCKIFWQELEVEKMMVNQSTPIKMEKNMNVVFLVRPTMTQMDTLANCIQR